MSVTATAYTYDELSEDAQKTAVNKSRHIPTEIWDWWTDDYETWIEKLADMGYETEKDKMWFSGFWSQGDGACFEAGVDLLKWLEHTDPTPEAEDGKTPEIEYRSLRYWLKKLGTGAAHVKIYHRGNYYHRFTMYVELEWSEWISPPKAIEQLESLEGAIIDHARDQALALYRGLESTCEAMMSDDYVSDFLQANGYLFWQDGTPARFS